VESIKALLKHVYSYSSHPSSSKRLGAAVVYNSIYTVLREDDSLTDQFTMEILAHFVESLALSHTDNPALGEWIIRGLCSTFRL